MVWNGNSFKTMDIFWYLWHIHIIFSGQMIAEPALTQFGPNVYPPKFGFDYW